MASTSPSNLYEMRFEWPHPEPTTVIVTGTFDQWSRSVHLKKTDDGFVALVPVPWAQKIKYKFIVDGRWLTQPGQPTETDPGGFVNNVHYTPPKPEPAVVEESNGSAAHEPAPVPEEPTKPCEATPAEEVQSTQKEEKVVEQPTVAPKTPQRRVSIPIVPVNAVEHNTILNTPPPAIPDYVLPPSPRARSASPPAPESRKVLVDVAPTPAPEPEPVKLHEVEVALEETIAVAPEVPLEEQKQEAEAHIPADCSDAHKESDPLKVEEPKEVQPKAIVASEPIPAPSAPPPAAKAPEQTLEKAKETKPIPSALPTPPATPAASKKDTFPRGSQSPSPTPTPSSSRFNTAKSRKKRVSIFGKLKEIFHHDKEKVPK